MLSWGAARLKNEVAQSRVCVYVCVTEEVQVDPCSRPSPICTRIANSCDHLPAVAGFLEGVLPIQ